MNKVKLKPCPFCGSIIAPRVMDQNEAMWIDPDPDYDGDLQIVVCCASRKGGCGASTGLCNTSERAVEVWNTRYTEKPSGINENAPNSGKTSLNEEFTDFIMKRFTGDSERF